METRYTFDMFLITLLIVKKVTFVRGDERQKARITFLDHRIRPGNERPGHLAITFKGIFAQFLFRAMTY